MSSARANRVGIVNLVLGNLRIPPLLISSNLLVKGRQMKMLISRDSHWGIAWNESLLPGSPARSRVSNRLQRSAPGCRNGIWEPARHTGFVTAGQGGSRIVTSALGAGSALKAFYCSLFSPALGWGWWMCPMLDLTSVLERLLAGMLGTPGKGRRCLQSYVAR